MAHLTAKKKNVKGNIFVRFFSAFKPGRTRKKMRREDAIVVTDEISTLNECYNTLKTNVLFMSDAEKNKVIQMESSVSGEGKTTVACNLAVSISFNQKRVLVIDLDFRKPRVNRLFNVLNETGVVDYCSEKATIEQIIKHTSYKNVDVITRGSAIYNPSMLLTSKKFVDLMEKLRGMYDFIILDAPPVLQIAEYTHISKVSDGVLFIIYYGHTKRSQIAESAELLKKGNIRVIGSILTFVDNKDPYSYYYGNYKARYGYDTMEK